ncbi:unnamed protein product, partial [Ectocarpus sp. 12 AP-2014]
RKFKCIAHTFNLQPRRLLHRNHTLPVQASPKETCLLDNTYEYPRTNLAACKTKAFKLLVHGYCTQLAIGTLSKALLHNLGSKIVSSVRKTRSKLYKRQCKSPRTPTSSSIGNNIFCLLFLHTQTNPIVW